MYFADEVRDLRKSPSPKAQRCRNVRSISLRDLIDKMSVAESEPGNYQDEYRERFLAMVEQKTKGKEITIPPPAPERRGKVVDIFAALNKSLEQAAPQRQREPAREPARKAGGKRRKA
jgi:DNA end-binding protein Ku